jgi:hypothetical protein
VTAAPLNQFGCKSLQFAKLAWITINTNTQQSNRNLCLCNNVRCLSEQSSWCISFGGVIKIEVCGCLTVADVVSATDVLAAIYQWNAEQSISSVINYHYRQCVCIALVIHNDNRTLYTLMKTASLGLLEVKVRALPGEGDVTASPCFAGS